ncbi:MAG: hypothetical protein OEZ68_02400 [Gammaproteobacteria bacterium]|nr:hypothetical protein [Gammaproteobacteria bacterium]MDH5799633.1 hypothetical protein [Gammaproteobacteria bacterium]
MTSRIVVVVVVSMFYAGLTTGASEIGESKGKSATIKNIESEMNSGTDSVVTSQKNSSSPESSYSKIFSNVPPVESYIEILYVIFTILVTWGLYRVNKAQRYDALMNHYSQIHQNVWSESVADVRLWLLHDDSYKREIENILMRRNNLETQEQHLGLTASEYKKLDKLDNFINVIQRSELLPEFIRSRDRSMGVPYFDWWIEALIEKNRSEVIKYIEYHYSKLHKTIQRTADKLGVETTSLSDECSYDYLYSKINCWVKKYSDYIADTNTAEKRDSTTHDRREKFRIDHSIKNINTNTDDIAVGQENKIITFTCSNNMRHFVQLKKIANTNPTYSVKDSNDVCKTTPVYVDDTNVKIHYDPDCRS